MPGGAKACACQEPHSSCACCARADVAPAPPPGLGEHVPKRRWRRLLIAGATTRVVIDERGCFLEGDSSQQRRQGCESGQFLPAVGAAPQMAVYHGAVGGLDRSEYVDRQCLADFAARPAADHGPGPASKAVLPILMTTFSHRPAVHRIRLDEAANALHQAVDAQAGERHRANQTNPACRDARQ
jgi:hypothetical protein